ncbi:uncharacterized protein LOC117496177 [Trematomus bernacchii]|uniref:uncharacterized protein LOC117496177 n=1 Tax=Trematomus bernacchii TaxID=40690 RepID=UPI00146DCE91|nr:uncharacterized protein LOC117496177 [Trematomus bernacchii]
MHALHKLLLFQVLTSLGQNADGSKIINGKIADDKLMKYMVSVQDDNEHKCGGFLVSKHFVVTHGGCKFDEDGKVMVVLGTHYLSKPGSKVKEHFKSTCKPPPGIGTDIMLIEIYRTKPEDLPKEIQLQDPETDVKENEKCQFAGWGPVENDGSDYDDQLNVVNVTVISPKACKDQLPGLRANAICTGGKQTTDNGGFCKSDAGGPLVCKGKAVGIATVDDKCSFPGLPNVYIDISKYRSWIDKVLNGKIINRKIADDKLMKYMVSVEEDGEHICGGFLVSRHFVVTHGGCKSDEDGTVFVVLGTHHLSKPGSKIKEHIMSTCKPPPGIGTDIMLIEINSKKPEKLPKEIQLQDPETDVKENEKCQFAGWGPVKNDGSDHDDQLRVADVTVISPEACKVQIPGLRANAICTGGKQTTDNGGFCKRDAGGPLVCKGKAVGIATVNEDCSFTGLPNVYIDISKYRSWIDDVLNGKIANDNLMKYMVSVQEDGEHKCGGFLVSKHFVVTHGGCKFDEGIVVLGTHHLRRPGPKIKEHIMSTCKPPPGIGTDIMLIEIYRTKPDDLPKEIQLQDPETDVKENEKCQFAGWGPVENDGSDYVDQLHVVGVTVISPKACKVQIPGLRANAICTGGKQTTDNGGFCKRDAGGPLVCKGKAVGIATVNEDCSFTGLPSVYIDISKYRSWINARIIANKCLK